MIFRALCLPSCLTLVLLGGTASHAGIGVMTQSSERLSSIRLHEIEDNLVGLLRQHNLEVVPPAKVFALLSRDKNRLSKRRRAAELLRRASLLVAQVRYEEARRQLIHAETAAVAGLARLVGQKQLSDIYYLHGIAHLPVDRDRGLQYFVQSLQLWPDRLAMIGDLSPKLAADLKIAGQRAQVADSPAISTEEAQLAAEVISIDRLLLLTTTTQRGKEQAEIRLFDVDTKRWRSAELQWQIGTPSRKIRAKLRRAILRLFPVSARPLRMWDRWPLVLAATSGACLVTGLALLVASSNQLAEAEDLAGQQVEYYPQVFDIEQSAQRLRTTSLILTSLAAAGAVGVIAWWLWPNKTTTGTVRAVATPDVFRLVVEFP